MKDDDKAAPKMSSKQLESVGYKSILMVEVGTDRQKRRRKDVQTQS